MSTLEARIAEVLAEHHIVYWGRCKCGTVVAIDSTRETGDQLREHLASVTAAMLAPVIREREAEALREAADKFQTGDWHGVLQGGAVSRIGNGQRVTDWLRARADEVVAP